MREELRKKWNEMIGDDQEHRAWFARIWCECVEQVGFERGFMLWTMKNHGHVLREYEEYNIWLSEIKDGADGA